MIPVPLKRDCAARFREIAETLRSVFGAGSVIEGRQVIAPQGLDPSNHIVTGQEKNRNLIFMRGLLEFPGMNRLNLPKNLDTLYQLSLPDQTLRPKLDERRGQNSHQTNSTPETHAKGLPDFRRDAGCADSAEGWNTTKTPIQSDKFRLPRRFGFAIRAFPFESRSCF